MEALWFALLWIVLATYVVLDGFDLGVGALHLWVARTNAEREQVIRSVGPVWDGNEVWLVAAGGTMVMAFPVLFATAFSGFYLPLMIVLWGLIGRALGIELRHQIDDPIWTQFWDVVFALSSGLLIVCFGAALGNVVRGVSLDAQGVFFAPLWTNFGVGAKTGILDWYTLLVAVTALVALLHHGALWLSARTDALVQQRARRFAGLVWPVVAGAVVLTTVASLAVQPHLAESLRARPWGVGFALGSGAGLVAALALRRGGRHRAAFRASAVFLAGLMGCAAIGTYPYLLPARDPALGLTAQAAATHPDALGMALWWWIPGMGAVGGYTWAVLYRDRRGVGGRGH